MDNKRTQENTPKKASAFPVAKVHSASGANTGSLMKSLNAIWRANSYYRDAWIRRQLALIPAGSKILDAGCGGQPFRRYCGHLVYKAQDFARLDSRTDIIEGKYGPLDYECDITNIPAADGSFDVILCTEVLEHVPDPAAVIKEFGRLLRSGGILLLTAPLGSFLHQEPYHYYGGYTPHWYTRFLPEAGFDVRAIEQNGGFFRHFGQESQRVTRVLFRSNSIPVRVILMPLELVSWLIFTFGMPFLCFLGELLLRTPGITIGYHVVARRK
jgi:SAM-dependent methyltransferase